MKAYRNRLKGTLLRLLRIYISLCLFLLFSFSFEKSSLDATYVANEGFLISSHNRIILVDSLFQETYGVYSSPSPSILDSMINAERPFQHIDATLITHADGDHFDPSVVAKFLVHHPETVLICPAQAFILIREEQNFQNIKNQIYSIEIELGGKKELTLKGMDFKILRLKHSEDKADLKENLIYIVDMEGYTFIHLGDTEAKIKNYEPYEKLDVNAVDIAFSPCWNLWDPEGRHIIKNILKPRHLVLMHITPGNTYNERNRIRMFLKEFPQTVVFNKPLERHSFR